MSGIQVEQAEGGAGEVLLLVEGLTVKTPRGERALVHSLDLQVCNTTPSSLPLPHACPRLVLPLNGKHCTTTGLLPPIRSLRASWLWYGFRVS